MDENMHRDDNNMNIDNPYDSYDAYTTGSGNAAMTYGEDDSQNNLNYSYVQNQNVNNQTVNNPNIQNGFSFNQKPKKPAKTPEELRRIKRYVIVGVVIAAALIIVATAGLILFNPKKSLYGALTRTYNAKNLMEGGPGEAVQKFRDEGGAISADASFSGSGVKTSDVKPGVRVDVVRDSANDKMSGEVALTKAGNDAATVQFFSENGKTYVTVDNVLDGYLAADNDGFVETYNKSVLSKSFGEIDSEKLKGIELIAHLFGKSQGQEQGGKAPDLKFLENAFRKAKVKKAGSEEITVAGEPAKCKVYEVTLEKDEAIRFLTGIAGLVGGQNGEQPGQGDQQKPDQSQQGQGQSNGFDFFGSFGQMPGQMQQKSQETGIGELIELLQNAKEVVKGPVTFDVYVDSKYVRGFATKIDIKSKSKGDATLSIESHNTGIKNPLSSIDLDIDLNDGDQSLGLEAEVSYSSDNKTLDVKSTMETTSKETIIDAMIDNDSPKDVLAIDSGRQIVDIGTASDEEITSFLTKNSEGLREFLNNVSEIVGTPQGMGNYGGLGDYKDIFSDLFGEDFSDFFDKYEIPSFSDFFDKDEFSDFFSDDLFKDDFSNYDFDNSGNESNNDKEDDQDKDPLSDEDGEDDF